MYAIPFDKGSLSVEKESFPTKAQPIYTTTMLCLVVNGLPQNW